MEEDDEFGDLYTDVLRPLQPSNTTQQQAQTEGSSQKRPIDTNLESDDEEILFGVPNSNHTIKLEGTVNSATVDQKVGENDDLAEDEPVIARVLDGGGEMKLESSSNKDLNLIDEPILKITLDGREDKDVFLAGNRDNLIDSRETYEKFDIEDVETGIGNINGANGEGDDWESDSDDDLQIVLNDNNHGNVLMGKSGVMGSDDEDEDEDGEPLVILDDTNQGHIPMEEVEWGEDAAQTADGDKKELGDADKAEPKIGYGSHGYHPYHSQFKYVRPGAAAVASVGPGGVPGQVRPPVGMMPAASRGRGDWRPSGMKNVPLMQKGFHAGVGTPLYSSSAGRGLGGGLEFTLPSHKPIFDVDIDSFEEKPWKHPGIDISDYFNFGLNEESWKGYCKQLEHHRMEATMQSKISVHESGRAENVYDPDLPPELAAAAGMHIASSEPANVGKVDGGHGDLVNGSARLRPPLPMGRPIQVESGNGERLPSIDTRSTRFRDSDAVIEIVLQDFSNNDPLPAKDAAELPENDNFREDLSGSHESERDIVEEVAKKREWVARSGSCSNSVTDDRSGSSMNSAPNLLGKAKRTSSPPEASLHYSPQPKGSRSPYSDEDTDNLLEDGREKERADEGTPSVIPSNSKKEELTENIDVKHSPRLSSPASSASAEQLSIERDELVGARSGLRRNNKEAMALETTTAANIIPKDEKNYYSMKRQKISSHIQQSPLGEADDVEDLRTARSSENSKARSGSSRDFQKLQDGIDEEVVQRRHFIRDRDMKRPQNEDKEIARRKGRGERHEIGKKVNVEEGIKQDTHSRRDWEMEYAHCTNVKTENSLVRRKDKESSDGTWKHSVEDSHARARAEDTRKRGRDNERLDKNEHLQSRKQLENATSRGHREREVASRQKGRYETMDGKRRKEEYLSKNVEKEGILQRKRDRGDIPDVIRRDKGRTRDDDIQSHRNKEEGWISRERVEKQKEREEWHKMKQINEDGRGVRSSRIGEDKPSWVGLSKEKDGFKRRGHMDDLGPSLHNRGHEDVLYPRGNQLNSDDRRSRQDSANTRNDTNNKKLKEPTKKRREYKSGDQRNLHSSIPSQEQSVIKNELVTKSGIHRHHQSSRKQKEDASSEDEHQPQDSRRGRSKMERWTSDKYGVKDDSTLVGETTDGKKSEMKPLDDKHLDTVAKLKKRSERFKLPMPSEKDVTAVKKIESEPMNSSTGGDTTTTTTTELEVKPERPARKRRWTGN